MIYGITIVKNEADILYHTVQHMLTQVDYVEIRDNMCTDGTRDVIHELSKVSGGRVAASVDGDPGFWQATKMTELAHDVGRMGATWIVPFDADEAWFFLDALRELPPTVTKVYATQYIYVPTPSDDVTEPNPLLRIGHRQSIPDGHKKVAFRYHPDAILHMGSHDVHYPAGGESMDLGVIRHYMYRSCPQVAQKVRNGAAAYALTDLPAEFGSHWRTMAEMTDTDLRHWWDSYIRQAGLVYDPWPR